MLREELLEERAQQLQIVAEQLLDCFYEDAEGWCVEGQDKDLIRVSDDVEDVIRHAMDLLYAPESPLNDQDY